MLKTALTTSTATTHDLQYYQKGLTDLVEPIIQTLVSTTSIDYWVSGSVWQAYPLATFSPEAELAMMVSANDKRVNYLTVRLRDVSEDDSIFLVLEQCLTAAKDVQTQLQELATQLKDPQKVGEALVALGRLCASVYTLPSGCMLDLHKFFPQEAYAEFTRFDNYDLAVKYGFFLTAAKQGNAVGLELLASYLLGSEKGLRGIAKGNTTAAQLLLLAFLNGNDTIPRALGVYSRAKVFGRELSASTFAAIAEYYRVVGTVVDIVQYKLAIVREVVNSLNLKLPVVPLRIQNITGSADLELKRFVHSDSPISPPTSPKIARSAPGPSPTFTMPPSTAPFNSSPASSTSLVLGSTQG